MKTALYYILFLTSSTLILTASSCEKDLTFPSTNSNGEIDALPYLWKYPLHKDGNFHSNSQIRCNLVFEDKVLIGTTEGEGDNWLNAVNIETGEEIWKWNDIYQPPTEQMNIVDYYLNGNIMGYIVGSRHYAIDLNTGATHWKIRRSTSYSAKMTGLGNTYFIIGRPTDTLQQFATEVIFQGNFETGKIKRILSPEFSTEQTLGNRIGQVTSVIPFTENSDTMLLVGWQDIIYPNFFQTYLGLYNLTQKEWVYKKAYLNDPAWNGVLLFPTSLYEEKAYMCVGNELFCLNVSPGQLIWKAKFTAELFFSGIHAADGRVLANCENKILYCFNASNGTLLWTGEGAGTSSPLTDRYLDEILYFSGGSSGYIHAVDTRTGKTVWKLDPAKFEDDAHFWKGDLYVVPGKDGGKGKVIALTPGNAYCFEAYQP